VVTESSETRTGSCGAGAGTGAVSAGALVEVEEGATTPGSGAGEGSGWQHGAAEQAPTRRTRERRILVEVVTAGILPLHRLVCKGLRSARGRDCRIEAEIFVAPCPSGRGAIGFRFWAERTTRMGFGADALLEPPPPEDLEG